MKILFQLLFVTILIGSLYLSLTPVASSMPMLLNDKLIHLLSYFAFILTLDFSVKPGENLWQKAVVTFVYSCIIEYAQGFVPGREVLIWDVLANGVGILCYVLSVPLLKKLSVYKVLRIT